MLVNPLEHVMNDVLGPKPHWLRCEKREGDWCPPSSSAIAMEGEMHSWSQPAKRERKATTVEDIGGASSAGFPWTGSDFWESWFKLVGRDGRRGGRGFCGYVGRNTPFQQIGGCYLFHDIESSSIADERCLHR